MSPAMYSLLLEQLFKDGDSRDDKTELYPLLGLEDKMDDDTEDLVIDSPDLSPVEDEDLSDVDGLTTLRGTSAAPGTSSTASKPKKDRDGDRKQFLTYPESLPYPCESLEEMDTQLDFIVNRIAQCVISKDYDVGLLQWTHRLECWMSLKYPMKRTVRAKLARLYFELAVLPGMDPRLVEPTASMCMTLLSNKKRIDIADLQLPWEPLHAALEGELFPKKRKTGITNISITLLTLTEYCQRFFPPHEIPKMLETFLPRLDGSSLNSILATQSFMAQFLPLSHPQQWLDPSFVLWEAFSNSQMFTEQWLDVMARLAEKHVHPSISDPRLIEKYRRLAEQNALNRGPTIEVTPAGSTAANSTAASSALQPSLSSSSASSSSYVVVRSPEPEETKSVTSDAGGVTPTPSSPSPPEDAHMADASSSRAAATSPQPEAAGKTPSPKWKGIRKDVGIFTTEQWDLLMDKALRAMGIPVGNIRKSGANFISQGGEIGAANADGAANATVMKMKKPSEKLQSLACLIVYSMSPDSPVLDKTPAGSEHPSRSSSAMSLVDLASNGVKSLASSSASSSIPGSPPSRKAYIGGSRALDSLVKFVNATETFFHPSNWGPWTIALSRFLQNLLWEFTKRWIEEEKSDCKTPREWRLTFRIRREFVLATRQVALLAMFGKDKLSQGCAQLALRSMAYLEPSLVIPGLLERSFPALQGLLETHRTEACMAALATTALATVSRTNYPAGSKNLLPLLDLCIPGLDVNDPIKTLSSVSYIMQALATVRIADLTRRECIEAEEQLRETSGASGSTSENAGAAPQLTFDGAIDDSIEGIVLPREEEDALTRESTADFPEWIAKFFKAVLALFDHLPEPGRSGKSGGKTEEAMIGTVTVACDLILSQCSPEIYDVAIQVFAKHVIASPRSNSARAVGHVAACFGRANPAKALATFLPVCIKNIKIELENGASSTRTTSTQTPIESDNAFHWYCLLLLGSLHMAAEQILPYKADLLDLLKTMRDKCFSEKGFSFAGRMLQATLASLCAVWARDGRSANADEWNSKDYSARSHLYWGKEYAAADVKVEWHQPSPAEVDFAMELLDLVVRDTTDKLESIVESSTPVNKDWRNDFNRYTNLIRAGLAGVSALTVPIEPQTPGVESSDVGHEDMEFIREVPRYTYGAALSDPSDPRLRTIYALKDRVQTLLHKAFQRMSAVNDKSEDAIDSIKMAITTSKHLLLNHPIERTSHDSIKANFVFARDMVKYTVNQKKFPRLVWVRRASLYHASRLRLSTFYRKRSAADDLLIRDIAELAMSKYVSVRKAAQRALDPITQVYDGSRSMLYDTYLAALQPGNDPDRMKGALYVLGGKSFGNMAILDWRVGPKYILKLLQCQHEQKPSVQQLVKAVTGDFIVRLAEPSTIKMKIGSQASQEAALALTGGNQASMQADATVASVARFAMERIDIRNAACETLVPDLLAVATDPANHWRYVLTATRFLRCLVRRDQPIREDVAKYIIKEVISELPNQRSTAMSTLTKILHFLKLRTYCASEEDLLLQKSRNPLKYKVDVPSNIDDTYTDRFLEHFKQPLSADSVLVDKHNTGWLVWGKQYEAYRVPASAQHTWDESSAAAIIAMREQVMTKAFWEAMLRNLSQEHSRDYLALDNVTIMKSIFQIYRDEPLDIVMPLLSDMMADKDRHKQRAAAEVIGGMLRGAKHWPMPMQQKLYDWLAKQWQSIFDNINIETQPAWEMMVEYVLGNRDPRRSESLMEFLTGLKMDIESSEAFREARKGYILGSTMKSLSWHFTPWTQDFTDTFWTAITSPYTEVRLAVSDNLKYLSEMRLHPSFTSTEAFLSACRAKNGMQLLIAVDDAYVQRIDQLVTSLQEWRKIRQPFSKDAVQPYDAACLTVLTWLWSGMNDYRVTAVYPFVERLLPELLHMHDLQDNQELVKWASVVLASMAALPYPAERVPNILDSLLDLFSSTSWRTRLAVLPLLQVFFFHQLFVLTEDQTRKVVTTLCELLRDNHIEVREAASTTLSGIVRCSQRDSILVFKDRFLREIRRTTVPGKKDVKVTDQSAFQAKLIDAHAAVLGASALVLAWPYEVPAWLPELLLATANKFSAARAPVSTTVKDMLAQFRKTHQDTWTEDQKKFTSDQLQDLNDLVIGTSYYA